MGEELKLFLIQLEKQLSYFEGNVLTAYDLRDAIRDAAEYTNEQLRLAKKD